ncbi:Maf family protein [Amycolatopsis samaneae]|uniref:Nucleoside triphosphate pyrophosphatase n=1 Tax=Amycolatopsis samaneae TaxID=664691 RepID=A0ABW5GFE2_9PSEU
MRFVLGSQSPARLAVLRAAGLDPRVVVSGVDEDAVIAASAGLHSGQVVAALAMAKAEAVVATLAGERGDAVVMGCDSMLLIDGELVGKPGTVEIARRRWQAMAGNSGALLTGHAVIRVKDGEAIEKTSGTEATKVHFSTPDADELEAYLASGEPLQVAGGFTLDGLGGWFVKGVEGDPSSVIGISLSLTRTLLAEVGVRVTDLWQPPTS